MYLSHKRIYFYFDKNDFVWVLTPRTKLHVYLEAGSVVLDERDLPENPSVCIINFEDPKEVRELVDKLYKREVVYVKARRFIDSQRYIKKKFDVITNEDGIVEAVIKEDGWIPKKYKKYVFDKCRLVK